MSDTDSAEKKVFVIGGQQLRVRTQATLKSATVTWLKPSAQIEVDANSRTEADNYVWWHHSRGWSAEKSIDGTEINMTEAQAAPPATKQTKEAVGVKPEEHTAFQVGNEQVRVRTQPSLSGMHVKWLAPGTIIQVVPTSRTEASGYVWWQHADGWSAEKKIDGSEVNLFEPGTVKIDPAAASKTAKPGAASVPLGPDGLPDVNQLPLLNSLFQRLPVDQDKIRWWQYYGNNVYAFNLWTQGKYWYKYCQALHGGLDFGNSNDKGVLIYAGVEGTYNKLDTKYTRPNGQWVTVGDYTIIYGHLINPRPFNPGDAIHPDTIMGEIDLGGQNHLHLEVRYMNKWIVNPQLYMTQDMRDWITKKFPPSAKYFYQDSGWNQWQTPMDQPVLVLGGPVIGPLGKH
ncbi:MAG: hypothetical protein H6672_12535 [Anaerolineaceae bacterium]|nr:hypothetical protein [Anaerolineaceae bacterium]